MSGAVPILLFVALTLIIIPGVVALIIYAVRAHRARQQSLADLAAQLGWTFTESEDRDHKNRYRQFQVFRRGDSQRAYNTMQGTLQIAGRDCFCRMGDYRYDETTTNGKQTTTTTTHFSYLLLHLPFTDVPGLLIRPENILDKLAGAVGFQDINFESAEFSRKFFVKSSDRRFAYDVVHPKMMEWLLSMKPPVIDLEEGVLCLADGVRWWDADGFRRHLAFAASFLALWPDHLTSRLAPAPAPVIR